MSRTHAHVPEAVELARISNKGILRTRHVHWAIGRGMISCLDPDARCHPYVPKWASQQPPARRGSARLERRTVIDNQLRRAAREYRTFGEVDTDVYTDPCRRCLCECCW